MRLIDEKGEQIGIIETKNALDMARARNLDLIQVTDKTEPPVCKLGEYGKYLYSLRKKERKTQGKQKSEIKSIRIGFNTSIHDLETRANQAKKFLESGDKVKIEMVLRGREKWLGKTAENKVKQFLEILEKLISIKIERGIKREPRGFTMIISKK